MKEIFVPTEIQTNWAVNKFLLKLNTEGYIVKESSKQKKIEHYCLSQSPQYNAALCLYLITVSKCIDLATNNKLIILQVLYLVVWKPRVALVNNNKVVIDNKKKVQVCLNALMLVNSRRINTLTNVTQSKHYYFNDMNVFIQKI